MFNLEPINIIGVVVSLGLLYQSVRLVRDRKESVFEFLLWLAFGGGLLFYSLARTVTIRDTLQILYRGLEFLGFSGGINGLFALAILGLLLMLFYTYVNAKTNRQKLYDLNQEIALLRYEQERRGAATETKSIDESTD